VAGGVAVVTVAIVVEVGCVGLVDEGKPVVSTVDVVDKLVAEVVDDSTADVVDESVAEVVGDSTAVVVDELIAEVVDELVAEVVDDSTGGVVDESTAVVDEFVYGGKLEVVEAVDTTTDVCAGVVAFDMAVMHDLNCGTDVTAPGIRAGPGTE
jgi:hypothetical protein